MGNLCIGKRSRPGGYRLQSVGAGDSRELLQVLFICHVIPPRDAAAAAATATVVVVPQRLAQLYIRVFTYRKRERRANIAKRGATSDWLQVLFRSRRRLPVWVHVQFVWLLLRLSDFSRFVLQDAGRDGWHCAYDWYIIIKGRQGMAQEMREKQVIVCTRLSRHHLGLFWLCVQRRRSKRDDRLGCSALIAPIESQLRMTSSMVKSFISFEKLKKKKGKRRYRNQKWFARLIQLFSTGIFSYQ